MKKSRAKNRQLVWILLNIAFLLKKIQFKLEISMFLYLAEGWFMITAKVMNYKTVNLERKKNDWHLQVLLILVKMCTEVIITTILWSDFLVSLGLHAYKIISYFIDSLKQHQTPGMGNTIIKSKRLAYYRYARRT